MKKLLDFVKNLFRKRTEKEKRLQKELKQLKKDRKLRAKNMTEYERILSFPLESEKRTDKFLLNLAQGDQDLLMFLNNIHRQNTTDLFIGGNKNMMELSLHLGKRVWEKLKRLETGKLTIARSPRFRVTYMHPYLLDSKGNQHELDTIDPRTCTYSVGFDIKSEDIAVGSGNHIVLPGEVMELYEKLKNDKYTLIEGAADAIIERYEEYSLNVLEGNASVKEDIPFIEDAVALDYHYLKLRQRSFSQSNKFRIFANETTLKNLPEKLSEKDSVVNTTVLKNMPDGELYILLDTDHTTDVSWRTYLYNVALELGYIDPNISRAPSLLATYRIADLVNKPYITKITIKDEESE